MKTQEETRCMLQGLRGAMLTSALVLGLAVQGTSPAAAALASSGDAFAGMSPLADSELGDMRGGFSFGGINFNFAVTIRSIVKDAMDNAFGMMTKLTLNNAGQVASSTTTVIGTPSEVSTPSSGDGTPVQVSVGNEQTQLVHDIALDHLQAITTNTASGVSINQDVDVNVMMPGFKSAMAKFSKASIVNNIQRQIGVSGL